ncbi:uncharacterized protein LOC116017214 [Ipomoea triloba]|uniref:uncharacterized protein LOC116017214 n=1 Tax=Ipomoea triloba TaxID=35885 RepID=UPI00125D4698|nr:uncharacterized protein LOC116017214 [Ipomoea triloba]
MGRLNSMNAQYPKLRHFAHPHELELVNLNLHNPNPNPSICSACKLQESSGQMYICRPCNFTLHLSCTQFPELISHPCHPEHPLTLLPASSYPGGLFNCDACNRRGDGFNYHCVHCEFDLHVFCASKPLRIAHHMHKCPLQLVFNNPYDDVKGFSCDVCKKIGIKQWLYRCSSCEFDVHLDCSTASAPKPLPLHPQPPPIRHHHSFLGSTSHSQYQQVPVAQGGSLIRPNQLQQQSAGTGAVAYNQFVQTPPAPAIVVQAGGYTRPTLTQHAQHQPAMGRSGLLNAAIQGLVEGASQQVGQTIMGSILGRGTDENGNA